MGICPEPIESAVNTRDSNRQLAYSHGSTRTFTSQANPPGFKRLAEIRVPTLVMIGDRDVRGMRFIAQQLHARILGSSIVEVPGADHIVNMSQTRALNRILLDFLGNPV
jgi:pimeloyl-ACP methyl ester carboxylesterase